MSLNNDTDILVDVPCVILAGGNSMRFGSPKGLAELRGKPIVVHVLENITKQTSGPVMINANQPKLYEDFGNVIEDPAEFRLLGPLAGILSAILWAEDANYEKVATVPIDSPMLPGTLLQKLMEFSGPTFAATAERDHYLTGLWSVRQKIDLQEFLFKENYKAKDWVSSCSATPCLFDDGNAELHFSNINSRDDLQRLNNALGLIHLESK